MISLGKRSGVNCTRVNFPAILLAIALAKTSFQLQEHLQAVNVPQPVMRPKSDVPRLVFQALRILCYVLIVPVLDSYGMPFRLSVQSDPKPTRPDGGR
jgi:hypothetical protein